MVDERQNVRDVLDNLFEKTHCDCNVDWSLYETNPDLNLGELLGHKPLFGMALPLFLSASLYLCVD